TRTSGPPGWDISTARISRLQDQIDYYCALYGISKPAARRSCPRPGLSCRGTITVDTKRKRGRVVEGTGLENRQGFAPFVGSNPTASASHCPAPMAKLVDARDLKSLAARRPGSIPGGCTIPGRALRR